MFRKGLVFAFLAIALTGLSGLSLAEGYTPRVGECLEYDVIIKSMIQGAQQTIRVLESGTFQGRPVVKIQCVMNSTGLAKSITKYTEKEEILLDEEGLYPWTIRREVSDKDGTETEEVTFDYGQNRAYRECSKNGGFKERTEIQVPGYVQDVLSLQFFLRRNFNKEPNKIFFYGDGEVKEISYQIVRTNEPLNLECGNFPNYYQVINEEKKITILIADSNEHFPLVIRKIGKIGKVEARLVKIK